MRQVVPANMSKADIKPTIESTQSIALGAPFEEDRKPKIEKFRSPSLRWRSRSPSVESNASWGSDIADFGCQCLAHKDDELEVANWLLHADERDWAAPAPSPSQGEPSPPPFSYYQAPAAFFFHFCFTILSYLGLIPNHPVFTRPVITPSFQPPFPIKHVDHFAVPHLTKLDVRADGSRMLYNDSESYYLVDDMEYVIYGDPAFDQQDWHIPLTMDYSSEKLDTHLPGLLRVYRVPDSQYKTFIRNLYYRRLLGARVRPPHDRYDNVVVFRQGFITFQPKPVKGEYWMLVGTDAAILQNLEQQSSPWWRSISSILLDILDYSMWHLYHDMTYSLPRFIRRF